MPDPILIHPDEELVSVSRARDFPDAGGGACCMGSAARGPGYCTCWEPAYDREQADPQADPQADLPDSVRDGCCRDCAFRAGSPERMGDERYRHAGEEGLTRLLAAENAVFVCHQGLRRLLGWRHPFGAWVEAEGDAYEPAVVGRRGFRADGRPAEVCAGYSAIRLSGKPAKGCGDLPCASGFFSSKE